MPWKPDDLSNPISFCVCDTNWADPECSTKRKSQMVAYLLSLFGGCLGLDHFYLENYLSGALKLLSFGGLGVWWCIDIIRIGSAPVMAYSFRTAADFPHSAFVLTTVMYSMIVGSILVYFGTLQFRARRRARAMQMQADEEQQQSGKLYKAVFESRPHVGRVAGQARPGAVGGPVDFFNHKDVQTYKDKVPAGLRQGYGSMGPPPKNVTL